MRSRFVEVATAVVLLGCGSAPAETDTGAAIAAPVEAEAEVAATLTRVTGDVRRLRSGTSAWAPARVDDALYAADEVQTMADAHASVRFAPTESTVELGPRGVLRVPEQPAARRRLQHVSGELVARLEADATTPLEIALPPGDLVLEPQPSGAESRIDVAGGEATVAMVHGAGRIERVGGEPIAVAEARYVRLAEDGELLDEGADIAAPSALLEPAGASVHVRDAVGFSWAPVPGATAYRLFVAPSEGERIAATVPTPQARVRLRSGSYQWWVRAEGAHGVGRPSAHRDLVVVFDREAPRLTISAPAASGIATGPTVRVAGRTEPGAHVTVDRIAVVVRPDGSFESTASVPMGLANVVVRAVDRAGNARVLTRQVVRR